MSYPPDLDEIPESKLVAEIARRQQARSVGICDYCGRFPDESPCRFPERHQMPAQTGS